MRCYSLPRWRQPRHPNTRREVAGEIRFLRKMVADRSAYEKTLIRHCCYQLVVSTANAEERTWAEQERAHSHEVNALFSYMNKLSRF